MHTFLCSSWRLPAVAVVSAMLITCHGLAGQPSDAKGRPAAAGGKKKQRSRTTSRAAKRQGEEMFGVTWFDSLDGAGNAAGRERPLRERKPIFCFRVLGDLAGFM